MNNYLYIYIYTDILNFIVHITSALALEVGQCAPAIRIQRLQQHLTWVGCPGMARDRNRGSQVEFWKGLAV